MDIKAYEAMAKLALSEEERQWVSERAAALVDRFGVLESIDTSSTEPLYTVLDVKNVLREDVCSKLVERDVLLSNAPEEYDGYFQVPRTLD